MLTFLRRRYWFVPTYSYDLLIEFRTFQRQLWRGTIDLAELTSNRCVFDNFAGTKYEPI